MKTIIIALFIILAGLQAVAQDMAVDSVYYSATASLHKDTTAVVKIGSGPQVVYIRFKDSVNVKIYFDWKRSDEDSVYQTYTLVGDSTNSTSAWGTAKSYILRAQGVNYIPGARYGRLRIEALSTKNGATSPYYDAELMEY